MGYLHEEPEPVVEAQLRVPTGAGDTGSWAVRHAVDAVSAGICAETFAPDADAECTASHVSADCSTFTSVQRDRLHRARLASSARRGFTCRSTYNANCFLRNKFSAASRAREHGARDVNCTTSTAILRTVRVTLRNRAESCLRMDTR